MRGAEDGPIGGAGTLKAGVDDVLRAVGLVGLRDQAASMIELRPLRRAADWGMS